MQALEEFPYNNEFVGRNFNAGEVIQLVLRDRNGRWLPQRMVEMVMVHELAHCKQMNHSKAFWKVRDEYAGDLRALWGKGYSGEGLWGRGRELDTGVLQMGEADVPDVPEHLCGGTYGRRAGKRKRGAKDKPTLSYAERKQRRILKKFGTGGLALGADDDTKVKLEGGLPKKGKPRVAGSARGRDLRAAAALARFDTAKKEEIAIKKDEPSSDSETEDEFVEGDQDGAAVDVDGKKMLDEQGRALIKICEDEDDKDGNARREMDEIQGFATRSNFSAKPVPSASNGGKPPVRSKSPSSSRSDSRTNGSTKSRQSKSTKPPTAPAVHLNELWKRRPDGESDPRATVPAPSLSCSICSFANNEGSLTCVACANVLNPSLVPDHWKCNGVTCKETAYINAGDAGRCGVCGATKKAT